MTALPGQFPIVLVQPNHKILNEVAQAVHPSAVSSNRIQALVSAMLKIAAGEQGDATRKTMVGLAAPQVGISKRVIIVDISATGMGETPNLKAYVSPVIIARSDQTEPGREGCYSTGNICGIVDRASTITVQAYDGTGQSITETWSGFTARIFQHEIDHLDGIRFPDRIQDDTHLHWVEDNEFGEYRQRWANWPAICPRGRWEVMKGSVAS